MAIKNEFNIKIKLIDEYRKLGHFFLELNGKLFGNNELVCDINEALNSTIKCINYSNKFNYSKMLYSLEKIKFIKLWGIVRFNENFNEAQYLKEYLLEMEDKVGGISLFPSHDHFDSISVMLIRSNVGERLIVRDDYNIEEYYFENEDSFLKRLVESKAKLGLPQFFDDFSILSSDDQEFKEFRCNGFGTEKVIETIIMNTQKNVFNYILFRGAPEENEFKPLIENEIESKKKFKDYFDKFFNNNFINFIEGAEIRSFLTEVSGGYQITMDVKVKFKSLIEDLIRNKIIPV